MRQERTFTFGSEIDLCLSLALSRRLVADWRTMKLLPDGPDIPQELLTTQEKGEVLFICGAGVSMTVGLPSFRGLVVAVYEALGENWRLHPAEREVMDAMLIERADQLREVHQRAREPVDLVDHDNVDYPLLDVPEQPLQRRPLERAAGEAAVIVVLTHQNRFLERDDAALMWARADGTRWKAICWRFGISRATAHRRWEYALSVIAWRLNGRQPNLRRGRRFVVKRARQ